MAIRKTSLFILVASSISCIMASDPVKEMIQRKLDQLYKKPALTGYAHLCDGAPRRTSLIWTPLSPDPKGYLTVNANITFEEEFLDGLVALSWYTRLDETSPWREATGLSQRLTCAQIEKYLKYSDVKTNALPKCPYQKNDIIVGTQVLSDLQALPFGYNSFVFKITNQKNHLVTCLNATLYLEFNMMRRNITAKNVSTGHFRTNPPEIIKHSKKTFESTSNSNPTIIHSHEGRTELDWNMNRYKSLSNGQPLQKIHINEEWEKLKSMMNMNTRLDFPWDVDEKDLEYNPYDYRNDQYGTRPETSYMAVPFASRNRGLESIAECVTPSSSGGDLTPEEVEQIRQFTPERVLKESSDVNDPKQVVFPNIQENKKVAPVKIKSVLSLKDDEKLPSIPNAFQRIERTETFLAQTRFLNQTRSESVESIATPSTSRYLLWSRESIMSDGGFSKARSDTNMSKLSFKSEPTPTMLNSSKKKKVRKCRRKPATKFNMPYQSFMETVIGKKKYDEKKNPKTFIKSAKFTLNFPSIHKKVTITPVRKDGKWNSK